MKSLKVNFVRKEKIPLIIMFSIVMGGIAFVSLYKPSNSKSLDMALKQELDSQQKHVEAISEQLNSRIDKLQQTITNLNSQFLKELSFRDGLKFVLAAEGGLTNDPSDTGGLTNLGITHSEYELYRAKKNFPYAQLLKLL